MPSSETCPVHESIDLLHPASLTLITFHQRRSTIPASSPRSKALSLEARHLLRRCLKTLLSVSQPLGTALLLWRKKSPDFIVKMTGSQFQEGRKLPLRSPTGRASPEGGDITVRLVKGGNRLVTAVLHEGEALKLLCYDHTGHRREVILENLITVPAAMAVSRDDTKIAICCGNTIRLYRVDNGVPHLTGQLLAHSKCAAYDSHRRMQQVNFSVNSMMLVAATQEYRAQYKYPVYVRMWNCREREPRLEKELTPASISLVSTRTGLILATHRIVLMTRDAGLRRRFRSLQHLLLPRRSKPRSPQGFPDRGITPALLRHPHAHRTPSHQLRIPAQREPHRRRRTGSRPGLRQPLCLQERRRHAVQHRHQERPRPRRGGLVPRQPEAGPG